MKYVFIGAEGSNIRVLYYGFGNDENRGFILLKNGIRRIAKGLTLTNINAYALLRHQLKNTIGKYVEQKRWIDSICFILHGRIYESYGGAIIKYLRNSFQNCKIVIYNDDLISRHKVDIEKEKVIADAVLTFDIKDAEKYGIYWCQEPYSSEILEDETIKSPVRQWDVTFVGAAKMRYRNIISLYEELRKAGLSCDFHIVGVKPKDRAYVGEIGYEPMDYKEILRHVNASFCIAEVMQDFSGSPTTRYAESMLFKRNLLTNCDYFAPISNRKSNIYYFKEIMDLDKINLLNLRSIPTIDTKYYIDLFSISAMIQTVNRVLNIHE